MLRTEAKIDVKNTRSQLSALMDWKRNERTTSTNTVDHNEEHGSILDFELLLKGHDVT